MHTNQNLGVSSTLCSADMSEVPSIPLLKSVSMTSQVAEEEETDNFFTAAVIPQVNHTVLSFISTIY